MLYVQLLYLVYWSNIYHLTFIIWSFILQLRVQQIADQEIPPPADDTVHEILNIKAFGYDCTLVEHFAQYTHNLSKNMSLSVFDR